MNWPVIAEALATWHDQQQRSLPWRGAPAGQRDPYQVWISEIMAQQTRMETVVDYFVRWMQRFPTIEALAAADQQEVLKQWEGLGYYARAREFASCRTNSGCRTWRSFAPRALRLAKAAGDR